MTWVMVDSDRPAKSNVSDSVAERIFTANPWISPDEGKEEEAVEEETIVVFWISVETRPLAVVVGLTDHCGRSQFIFHSQPP